MKLSSAIKHMWLQSLNRKCKVQRRCIIKRRRLHANHVLITYGFSLSVENRSFRETHSALNGRTNQYHIIELGAFSLQTHLDDSCNTRYSTGFPLFYTSFEGRNFELRITLCLQCGSSQETCSIS